MTHKERILATIKGQPTDRLPFLARLDLWYRANRENGTVPDKYKNHTFEEILDDLNLGYHAIIPNFQDLRSKDVTFRPTGATSEGWRVQRESVSQG